MNRYIDKPTFCAWILKELLPSLPKEAVLIMDNAAFHKQEAIQVALAQAGILLEYLPPYSPDLNPIEKKWAQAKAIRRAQQCSIDELFTNYPI